jgi:hypothetical protein
MRPRVLASAQPLALWACVVACNSVLGNRPGDLVDGGADDAAPEIGTEAAADASSESVPAEASPEAPAPEAPTPWDPSSLGAALVLWLDGDHDITTASCAPSECVQVWGDRSSYGNDASPPAGSPAPTFVPSQYNGHGAVRFDGEFTSLAVADVPSLQFANGYAILGVVAEQPASQQGTVYGKTAPGYPYAGPALWVDYFNQGAGIPATDGYAAAQVDYTQFILSNQLHLDDGTLRVYGVNFDGEVLTLHAGDAAPVTMTVTVAPGSLQAIGKDAYVGGPPNGVASTSQIVLGDIAELLVVNESLDDPGWASAIAYLKAKYALP